MSSTEKKILCVGIVVLDSVQLFDSYPLEDSEVRSKSFKWRRGGNASNNCTVLRQLGVPCEFLGTFSKKTHYKFLIHDDMLRHGISTEHCVFYSDIESPLSVIILSESTGSRTILHHNPGLPELTINDFNKLDLDNYSWIHFEGRNCSEVRLMMQTVDTWNKHLEKGKERITISLELEKKRIELLELVPYADVLIIGKDFATFRGYTNMKQTLCGLAQYSKLSAILVSAWGEKGAMGRTPDGHFFESLPYTPPQIKDTLGAGDTFLASLIYSLWSKNSLQKSVTFACKIAGIKIGDEGYEHISKLVHSVTF